MTKRSRNSLRVFGKVGRATPKASPNLYLSQRDKHIIGYLSLTNPKTVVDERSFVLATYALCGFANFSSIAIQVGGIGSLAPEQRGDMAKLGIRAMIGGLLASYLTATVAGILL